MVMVMIFNIIKKKIASWLGLGILKQEALLRKALKEENLDYKDFNIEIDHVNGINYVNGHALPIIYPISFFKKNQELAKCQKKYKFYFNGNMSSTGGRKEMLTPFEKRGAMIIESNDGRSRYKKKSLFNMNYFRGLAEGEFGLCPHQKDFVGNKDTMWTYRFIECCMTNTIPVVFKETPLGNVFCSGFYFVTDEQFLTGDVEYENEHANSNYTKCLRKFSLTKSYLNMIKSNS